MRFDGVALDAIPGREVGESLGARAMQSAWLARVYERWWRPVAFGLSTRFTAPGGQEEARLVIDRIADREGPWLDLSCGPGILTRLLVARAGGRTVYGVDSSRSMLERAHVAAPTAVLVRADAAELPFDDGVFGAVANLAALDLYAEPARVIAESSRVLARGGRWICSAFLSERPQRRGLSRRGDARKPTLAELSTMAENAGLDQVGSLRFHRYAVVWADRV